MDTGSLDVLLCKAEGVEGQSNRGIGKANCFAQLVGYEAVRLQPFSRTRDTQSWN